MSWIILFVAGLCECAWAVGLKYSRGFTRLYPSVFTAVMMTLSVVLLSLAMRRLPLGNAYAAWTGIGAVGTAILGIILFRDEVSFGRIFCLLLIIAGVIGLKFFTPQS